MQVKIKYIMLLLCAAALFIAAAYLDLALRGRSAFLEGERYMALALDPFSEKAEAGRAKERLPAGIGPEGTENAAKYAYIWYRTAAEDFSPPETRWTRLSRQKAPEALALWKSGTEGKR